jgi:nitroreductase
LVVRLFFFATYQEDTMDVLEAIRTKRATRQFADRAVPDDTIRQIVDAGRRSQSSKNDQPWTFVVVRDRETLRRLSECGTYAGHLAGAAFGVAIVAQPCYDFDQGQAAAYLQLAAWDLGVGSCIASMHDPDKAKAVLGVPEDLEFDTAISFGYPTQPPAAPKPGGRRPLDEVVRWEKF